MPISRKPVAGLAVLLALTACSDRDDELDPAAGRRAAERACAAMAEFEAAVGRDAPADDVLDLLRSADREGRRARDHDPRWTPLSAGIAGVQEGFEEDDGKVTRVGIDVVRGECDRLSS